MGTFCGFSASAWVTEETATDDKDSDESVSRNDVPERVLKALEALAGKAKITEFEREKEDGVVVYEAAWTVDGRESEAVVTSDGDLVEREDDIDPKSLPRLVAKEAKALLENGKDLEVERKTVIVYEIEGIIGDKEIEINVLPKGRRIDDEAGK